MLKRLRREKFRSRTIAIGLFTLGISIVMIGLINRGVYSVLRQVQGSYATNRTLTAVQNALERTQSNLAEYLETKNEDALRAYNSDAAAYQLMIREFNTGYSTNETRVMEKNIRRMSSSYFAGAEAAIAAKSERDIETYQAHYAEVTEIYRYLTALIYTFNSRQLEVNAGTYEQVVQSSRLSVRSNWLMLALLAMLDAILVLMLDRVSEAAIREETILTEAQVREAELKFLQAQINPHFLFNTMNAGAQLAMLEEADRTYRYLHKVADFYRYTVQQENGMTTLSKEVRLIDDYIYIINVRYGGEIHYTKEVARDILDYPVPAMILQPIVENSVRHGLSEMEDEKRIELTARYANERLEISVMDNGAGMDDVTIARVLAEQSERKPSENDEPGGVGMRNVLQRLRMYYNTEDVMDIRSEGPGKGTCVTLYLPVHDAEEADV